MPVIQFKGKAAIESYHHTIPHHKLEFDPKGSWEVTVGPMISRRLIQYPRASSSTPRQEGSHRGREDKKIIKPTYD